MPRDPSSSSGTHPDVEDLPDVPRTTELLMKLRKRNEKVSWRFLAPCLITLGLAIGYLVTGGVQALSQVAIWLGVAVLSFIGERWDRHSKREQMVFELLAELVAENNQLRRSLPESVKTTN